MTPHSTLKRKHSETTDTIPDNTGGAENVPDSPTKRMRIECSAYNGNNQFAISTMQSCLVSAFLEKEEEKEVLSILIPRDEDSKEEREVETDFTADSKGPHTSSLHNEDNSEYKENEDEQDDSSQSDNVASLSPYPDEFYLGSGSPSSSKSPSSSVIFLLPLQSHAGPSDLSNTQQREGSRAPSHSPSETVPLPISSHPTPRRSPSPPSFLIFEALQTLRRKYHPSPSPSRRSVEIFEPSEVPDEPGDIDGDEDEDFDLIQGMFGKSCASVEEAEAGNRYPVYIEETNIPELEETIANETDGDNVDLESPGIWWEHPDGQLSREPPAFNAFGAHIQEEDEDEEDPEARLKRLVREGEAESDGGT